MCVCVCVCVCVCACVHVCVRALTALTVVGDIAKKRYSSFIGQYNDTIWQYYNDNFANNTDARDVLFAAVRARGPEPAELHGEIMGVVAETHLPLEFVQVRTYVIRMKLTRAVVCCHMLVVELLLQQQARATICLLFHCR